MPIPKLNRPTQSTSLTDPPMTPLDAATEAGLTVVDWIDERTQLSPGVRWMLFRKVPKGINWAYTLGSATMFVFLSQAVTGVFLAMFYRPDVNGGAYESIRNINDNVFLGQFVHGMHKWGASMMIILIFMHMGRVFFFGAYKYPRELSWIVGYLLPFDQRSYWATIVGVNINNTAPFLGPYIGDFLRGGPEFGATTLSRFYAIHMMLIPGIMAALIGFHLYLVMKLGISAPPWLKTHDSDPVIERVEV
jgi:ubiquinol-cytochrome c reductase cytochrome b subunit/menaquinol-cytochrome c reductase cytochrome b subunit